jgi:hypothetical protein
MKFLVIIFRWLIHLQAIRNPRRWHRGGTKRNGPD